MIKTQPFKLNFIFVKESCKLVLCNTTIANINKIFKLRLFQKCNNLGIKFSGWNRGDPYLYIL